MCEALEISKRVYAKTEKLLRLCESVENANREAFAEIVRQVKEIEEEKGNIGLIKPQPCTKFRDAGTVEWTNEVIQEVQIVSQLEKMDNEVLSTVLWEARKRLAMELTDVITVCVSWLDAEGWDEEERGDLQRLVNEKNHERGYF